MGSNSVLQAFNERSGEWETLGEIGAVSAKQEFTFDIITSNFYSQFRIYANRQNSSFPQPLVLAFQIRSGTLKKATHEYLKKNKFVEKYYIDGMNDGQTIVELKLKDW